MNLKHVNNWDLIAELEKRSDVKIFQVPFNNIPDLRNLYLDLRGELPITTESIQKLRKKMKLTIDRT